MRKRTAVRVRPTKLWFGQQFALLLLLLITASSAWGAEMITNGVFNGSTGWTLGTATYDSATTRTAGSGSAKVAATRNVTTTGTVTQAVSIPAGATVDAVALYSRLVTSSEAVGDNISVSLRYADATTVNILSTGELTNSSAWTLRSAAPAIVLAQTVDQVIITLATRGGSTTGATASLWVDEFSISYTAHSDPLLHNSINLGAKYWSASSGWGIAGGQYGAFTCATCHNRNTANVKRVVGSIPASIGTAVDKQVIFNNVTAFGNDAGGHATSQRICEVCHTQTTVHKYNQTTGDLNHKNANLTDCTSCHAHNKSFGASCNTCHGYPPINATLGSDGLASPATGVLASGQGAHDTHVNLRGMTCETCHQGYTGNPMGNQHIEFGFNINGGTIAGFKGTFNGGSFAVKTPYAPYSSNSTYAGTTVNMSTGNNNTCSNLYCHGGYTGSNGSMMTPSWTAGATAKACGACHGTSQAAPPTSGQHLRHTGTAAGNMGIACSDCHGTLPADNAHVNGNVVTKLNPASKLQAGATYKGFANQSSAALSYGTCSLYCHSTVQTADASSPIYTSAVSPKWNDPAYNPLNCGTSQCHGNPPNNGAHAKHASQSYDCSICHSAAGKDTSKHADYKIDVAFSGTASGGTYDQAAVNPPGNGYGNCSNIYCHGTSTSIGWNGSLSDSTECDSCHGGNKSATTTAGYGPMATGRHSSHVANADATLATFACGRCHASTVTTGNDRLITGAAHVNGTPDVNYDSLNTGSTYVSASTCATNTYCHSSGKGQSGKAVDWTVASSLGCNGCHGTSNSMGAPDNGTPNSHGVHATLSADCVKCHAKSVTAAGNTLLAGSTDHLDRTINARLSKVSTYTSYSGAYRTDKTCSATYCHGGTVITPSWGTTGTIFCDSCHKASNVASGLSANHLVHYNSAAVVTSYTAPVPGNLSSIAYQFACTSCHGNNLNNHAKQPIATGSDAYVFFGFSSTGRNPAYGSAVRATPQPADGQGFKWSAGTADTCNNTYCHSNGQGGKGRLTTLTWASSKTGACNVCHGDATVSGTNDLSALHYRHIGNVSTGGNFGCKDCHALTVNSNTNVSTISKHVNKFNDYSGLMAGGSAKYTGATKQCSNIYCHSNGKGTKSDPAAWNAAIIDKGCNQCHGTGNSMGRPDSGTPNSHTAHANAATDCVKCHVKTVTTAGNAILAGSVDHLDRNIDARMKKLNSFANYSGRYNTNKTCSVTYCHGGNNTTPAWGGTSLLCAGCHESSKALAGAHMLHYSSATLPSKYANYSGNVSTATAYRFTCSSCHSQAKGATHVDGPLQYGAAQVFFGYTSSTKKGAYNYGTASNTDTKGFTWSVNGGNTLGNCNTTYCHSNGRGGDGASAVSWSTTSRGLNCNACHGNETNASALSGAHAAHMNPTAQLGGNFKCADCHATTITNTNNRTLASKAKHVNKFVDYSGLYAGGNKNCSNIYCHSDGKGNFRNPALGWSGGALLDCGGCHGSTSTGLPSTGSHGNHTTADCLNCHNGTTNLSGKITGTTHINKITNDVLAGGAFKTLATVSFGYTGTTCSNINCHSMGKFTAESVSWGGAALGCDGCHKLSSLSAPHSVHMGKLTAADVKFYSYTGNHSSGAEGASVAYGLGCGNCHPVGATAEATYHVDGTIQVMLAPAAEGSTLRSLNTNGTLNGTYNGDKTCDIVYCHSDGKNALATGATPNGHAPAWDSTFTGDRCANCHGNSPQTAAHNAHQVGIHYNNIFNGTSGKLAQTGTTSASSSHGVPGQSTTITCNTCHFKTVQLSQNDQNALCNTCHKGVNGATPKGNAKIAELGFHVNGKKEVSFQPALKVISKAQLRTGSFSNYSGLWDRNGESYKTGATAFDTAKVALSDSMYNAGAATCSNISCHNLRTGQSVVWTDTTLTCTSCHTKL